MFLSTGLWNLEYSFMCPCVRVDPELFPEENLGLAHGQSLNWPGYEKTENDAK